MSRQPESPPDDSDELIAEIREVRHRISERFGHDPYRMVAYYMERQKEHQERLIRAPESEVAVKSSKELRRSVMTEAPQVAPGDPLIVGRFSCVVSDVHSPTEIEVVYLDERDRAINEDAVWDGSHWEFKHMGPAGGYADKLSRLSRYVNKLRADRQKTKKTRGK